MSLGNFQNRKNLSEQGHPAPQELVDALEGYIRAQEGKTQLKSTPRYLRLVVKSLEQAIHAKENGNFCAVHSTQFPIELFWPLGIMPLYDELCGAVIGMIGHDGGRYPSSTPDTGLSRRNGAYFRTFHDLVEAGAWPAPDFVTCSGSRCTPAQTAAGTATDCMDAFGFCLDRPYKIVTPQSIEYWTREHLALLRFLEERTGREMDYDLLKEVTRLSFRATQIYLEINALRATVPCPLPAEASFAPLAVYGAWAGTQMCVDFLEQLRDELRDRVDRGIGAVRREKFRYTCSTSLPYLDLAVLTETEKRYGAVNVMDHLQWWREHADWLIDPDDPVASLAYRAQFGTASPLQGTVLDHAEALRQAALKCKADGVVHFNNLGCRDGAGGDRILKDTIERSLGLPWATINCGVLDSSLTSFDDVMGQLEHFFETVETSGTYQKRSLQNRLQSEGRLGAA
jgi:benzoyl-CoA reductase/2-hydroxyglutaryl-CoA dehydratase subunit BcrC/BadD/HgdB